MRAVRLAGAYDLELVELPDPAPGPGEVVVRVAAAGICGSDLSCYKAGVFAGCVLGHEFAGHVEAAGPGVNGCAPGQSVAVNPAIPCGACADCLAGAEHRCVSSLTGYLGGGRNGGFAELVLAPAACVHPLPPGLDPNDACLTEPLSIAIHGVNRGRVRAEDDALVIGLGPIGLLAIAALAARGVTRIVGVDPVESRRSLAQALGAERTAGSVGEVLGPFGVVMECSGRPELLQDAANRAAAGGRVVLLGVSMAEATVAPMVLVTREISVIGAISSAPEEFRASMELLAARPEIARIITRRVPLEGLSLAFDSLLAPTADAKIVADPRL